MEQRLTSLPDGTLVDALIGWRRWWIFAEDGKMLLTSWTIYSLNYRWPQRQPAQSVCRCGRVHSCGIYAWNAPHHLGDDGQGACGEVALWGDIELHELGYRAQFALPVALYVAGRERDWRVRLAARQYDVPVVKI